MKNKLKHLLINLFPCLLSVFFSITLPRLILLKSWPGYDEGIYAYWSQIVYSSISNGYGLPDVGMLGLYGIVLSWIFGLSVNHFIALRFIDMLVATTAGIMLYKVLKNESKSILAASLISFIFLFFMNQHIFIQYGFRNPIFAALIPLLWAMNIAQNIKDSDTKKWYFVGGLAALGVLLREPFMVFLILGAIAILSSYGWKPFFRFTIGSAFVGLGVVILICVFRGGFYKLLESYLDMALIYSPAKNMRILLFLSEGKKAVINSIPAICLFLISFCIYILYGSKKADNFSINDNKQVKHGKFLFWLAIVITALVEPISKMSAAYHFSVCLLGMACLVAHCYEKFTNKKYIILFAICLFFLLPQYYSLVEYQRVVAQLKKENKKFWDSSTVYMNSYALTAKVINDNFPYSKTLAVNGMQLVLFPLTGLLPSDYSISNLDLPVLKNNFQENKIRESIMACPPDILVITEPKKYIAGFVSTEALIKAIDNSNLYEVFATIPFADDDRYGGTYKFTIYKNKDENNSCKEW